MRAAVPARRLEHARATSGRRARPRARRRRRLRRRDRVQAPGSRRSSGAGRGRGRVLAPPRASSSGSVAPSAVRHLDDLEPEPGRVRLHDLAHLRARRLGDDDLRPPGRVLRHVAGVRGDRRAVVAGRVRDVHPGELADRRLVLEDRLQHALAQLGLVRRVGRQELAALEDGVDDRGDVVVVDPGAEERELCVGWRSRAASSSRWRDELLLRERRLEVELTAEAHACRNVGEELVHRRDADRLEHLLAVGVGQREVARHWLCSATCCR